MNHPEPFAATPVLGVKSAEAFLKKVEAAGKTGPVPTPKLEDTLKRFVEDWEAK